MFRRILVTLDGSEFAESAIPAAASIARRTGGELRLLTVTDGGLAFVGESGWTLVESEWHDVSQAARGYLENARASALPICPRVGTSVRAGYPVDQILEEADEFDADLLVMATHGRGSLSRLWLGSVASQCARHAHRPLLLIHPDETAGGTTRAPLPIGRIVVPLDGSDLSERAICPAVALADLFDCAVTFMRVVPEPGVGGVELFAEPHRDYYRRLEHAHDAAVEYLEGRGAPLRECGLAVISHAPIADDIPRAIVDEAGEDLIVMSTHARTGIERAFLGSVADAVIRQTDGPVLLIPPELRPAEPRAWRAAGWGMEPVPI